MTIFVVVVAAIWLVFAAVATRNILACRRLPPREELGDFAGRPRVSVIVAARDEEVRLEAAVRGLLEQADIELELIVVDDRSTDATPAILDRLSSEVPRLQVVRIESLPVGWLGKCHACWQGACRANGEWLLFADGDIHMCPDLIVRAVATAGRDGADHLCLWPSVNSRGALARSSILAWGQFLAVYCPAARINRDRGRRGVGIGAFNLVRASAYRAIGGHEPLRMEVVDDIKLGLLLRRAGFRQRLYSGFGDLEAEWAQSAWQVVKAVEKNWFAGLDYSLLKAAVVLLAIAILWIAGLAGPLLDPRYGWAALLGWLAPMVPALVQARLIRWPAYVVLLTPLGFVTFVLAGVHSTWKTLRQGGIRWRDTFYPLSALRAGLVK
jgi:glycosyltransferase involved in cell wall biosynthesis